MLPSLQASCLSPPQGPDGDRVLCSRHCLCCPAGLVTVCLPTRSYHEPRGSNLRPCRRVSTPGHRPALRRLSVQRTCSVLCASRISGPFCKDLLRWDLIPSYPEAELTGRECLMACTLISPESPSCLSCSRKSVNKRGINRILILCKWFLPLECGPSPGPALATEAASVGVMGLSLPQEPLWPGCWLPKGQ